MKIKSARDDQKTSTISARIPDRLVAKARALADKRLISTSAVIRQAIQFYVENREAIK